MRLRFTQCGVIAAVLCSLAGAELPAVAQTLTFQPAVSYATGTHPYAAAVGDLNNDTYPDIVVANSNSNSISVFLNQQNGTFAAVPGGFSIGNTPRSVVLADFNGDGKLDVATANYGTSKVGVRLGNGNGTFQDNTQYLVGGQPTTIATGLVNSDDVLDIVTVGTAGTLNVLKGNGDGTFQSVFSSTGGDAATSLVLSDFDKDGILDAAYASNVTDRITLRFGIGDGTFEAINEAADYVSLPNGGALSLRTTDLNRDTISDFVTANAGNGAIGGSSFRQGNGLGQFPNGTDNTLGIVPVAVETADLNGDGYPEAIFANSAQGKVSIGVGDESGAFSLSLQNFAVGSGVNHVAVGDFDKDGRLDIVAVNYDANSISVLINTTPSLARSLSGFITLQDTASAAVPLMFAFTPQDGSPMFSRTITPSADGSYLVTNLRPKAYSVAIKGAKWLQAVAVFDATSGSVSNVNVTLRGGDASNDNVVDITDLLTLIIHYNANVSGSNYLEAADFNNDGSCDITDLQILISNYNRLGE